MSYLRLAALVVAEAGIDTTLLAKSAWVGALDSALHGPEASFWGEEYYPDVVQKTSVLAVPIARTPSTARWQQTPPWGCLLTFIALDDH